jgi:putative restriction endonuclease
VTTSLPPAIETRLEKLAVDNGFDLELARDGAWLHFASSRAPLELWLSTFGDALFIVAFSQLSVARALEHGVPMSGPLPSGAVAGRTAVDIPELHSLVRRAFQLSRTLPDELLHAFESQTRALPRSTEVERLTIERVGQDIFRAGLLDYWEGRCAITGLGIAKLLRASHIKPWSRCDTDAERLDVFNGLLLAPHLDAAFDCGYLTFGDDGRIALSTHLASNEIVALGLAPGMRLQRVAVAHRAYLAWHRAHVFQAGPADLC